MDKYWLILRTVQYREHLLDLLISWPARFLKRNVEVPHSGGARIGLFNVAQSVLPTQAHYGLDAQLGQAFDAVLLRLRPAIEFLVNLMKVWQLFIGVCSLRENDRRREAMN